MENHEQTTTANIDILNDLTTVNPTAEINNQQSQILNNQSLISQQPAQQLVQPQQSLQYSKMYDNTITTVQQPLNTNATMPTISIDPVMDINKINLYDNNNTQLAKIINWIKNNIIVVVVILILICIIIYLIYINKDKIFKTEETKEQVFFNY